MHTHQAHERLQMDAFANQEYVRLRVCRQKHKYVGVYSLPNASEDKHTDTRKRGQVKSCKCMSALLVGASNQV